MIHTCAVKISGWCVRCLGNSEEERQVIQYGIEVILDAVGKTAAILLAGALMGRAPAFAASLVFFCSLRYWAGGIHCKTSFRCLIAMLAICQISVYGAFWLENSGEGLLRLYALFGSGRDGEKRLSGSEGETSKETRIRSVDDGRVDFDRDHQSFLVEMGLISAHVHRNNQYYSM